jgi:hypothetical protein
MADQTIVRLQEPKSVKEHGRPKCWTVIENGTAYEFPWGADFRISHHCDPENEVANLDANGGYPLLRDEFYQQHKDKFNIINED